MGLELSLSEHLSKIDSIFSQPSMAEIMLALVRDGGAWAKDQLATLKGMVMVHSITVSNYDTVEKFTISEHFQIAYLLLPCYNNMI